MRELSAASIADQDFLVALLTQPSFVRFIGERGVHTREQAHCYLADNVEASYGPEGLGVYRIDRRDTGEAIGICSLLKRKWLPDIDVGYCLLSAHEGQGFAREAAAATVARAHRQLGHARVLAITTVDNQASIRLLQALDFHPQGTVHSPHEPDVALNLYVSSPGN